MRMWNYVVTVHKPTNVTHSCVGNFTAPQDLNLIIAKCTRIEIHLLSPQGLQPMLDVPIYGRIATLELFRPPGETQDLLFIATERYKFCVLQWDTETGEVITRAMGDVSDWIGYPTDNGQIGIVDPDCRLIGLHLYDGLFKLCRHYYCVLLLCCSAATAARVSPPQSFCQGAVLQPPLLSGLPHRTNFSPGAVFQQPLLSGLPVAQLLSRRCSPAAAALGCPRCKTSLQALFSSRRLYPN